MRKLVLVAAAAALLACAAPVQASAPADVTISAEMHFLPGGPDGTFTATGPICATGRVDNLVSLFVGFQSNRQAQILVRHQFTCADGSGTFVLQLTVRLSLETFTTEFTWSVLDGTGAYAKLHGTGTGSDVLLPDGLVDTYTGRMHID